MGKINGRPSEFFEEPERNGNEHVFGTYTKTIPRKYNEDLLSLLKKNKLEPNDTFNTFDFFKRNPNFRVQLGELNKNYVYFYETGLQLYTFEVKNNHKSVCYFPIDSEGRVPCRRQRCVELIETGVEGWLLSNKMKPALYISIGNQRDILTENIEYLSALRKEDAGAGLKEMHLELTGLNAEMAQVFEDNRLEVEEALTKRIQKYKFWASANRCALCFYDPLDEFSIQLYSWSNGAKEPYAESNVLSRFIRTIVYEDLAAFLEDLQKSLEVS